MKKEVFDIIKILIIVFVFFYVLRLLKNLCEVDQIYESTKLIEGLCSDSNGTVLPDITDQGECVGEVGSETGNTWTPEGTCSGGDHQTEESCTSNGLCNDYETTSNVTQDTCSNLYTGGPDAQWTLNTWTPNSQATCAPDCTFTTGDSSTCGTGCNYTAPVAAVAESCASSDGSDAACAAVTNDGTEATCTGAGGTCVYTAPVAAVAESCATDPNLVCAGDSSSCDSTSGCVYTAPSSQGTCSDGNFTSEQLCIAQGSCNDLNQSGTADDCETLHTANSERATWTPFTWTPSGTTTDPQTYNCTIPTIPSNYVLGTPGDITTLECAPNHAGTALVGGGEPSLSTCNANGEYQLSGCPSCTVPDSNNLPQGYQLDSSNNIICSTGYLGNVEMGCPIGGGNYTLSGCTPSVNQNNVCLDQNSNVISGINDETSCGHCNNINGGTITDENTCEDGTYHSVLASCSGTNSANEVLTSRGACEGAVGECYEDGALVTELDATGSPRGCIWTPSIEAVWTPHTWVGSGNQSAPSCVRPVNTAYNFSGANETLSIDGFDVQGITCNTGYQESSDGVGITVQPCSNNGEEYSVSGCIIQNNDTNDTDCSDGYIQGTVDVPSTTCPQGCILTNATDEIVAQCGTTDQSDACKNGTELNCSTLGNTPGDCTWNQGACLTKNVTECLDIMITDQPTCEGAGSCTWSPMVPAQEETCTILTDNSDQETNNAVQAATNACTASASAAQAVSDQAATDGNLEGAANAQILANDAMDCVNELNNSVSSGEVTIEQIKEILEKTQKNNEKLSETIDLNRQDLIKINSKLSHAVAVGGSAESRWEHLDELHKKQDDPLKTWGLIILVVFGFVVLVVIFYLKFKGVEDVANIVREASSDIINIKK